MSNHWLNRAFGPQPGISSAEKFVLVVLADAAHDDGLSWVSVGRIALYTGLGTRAVQYALRKLEACGRIVVQKNGGPRGTNRYWVSIPEVPDLFNDGGACGAGVHVVHPAQDAPGGCTTCTGGVHVVQGGGAPHAPEPSVTLSEPSVTLKGAGAPSDPPDPDPAPKTKRKRDEVFEALAEIQGSKLDGLTRSERGRLNAALLEIRTASPGVNAATVRYRAQLYTAAMPGAALTATALSAHWSRLEGLKKNNGAAANCDRPARTLVDPGEQAPEGMDLPMFLAAHYPGANRDLEWYQLPADVRRAARVQFAHVEKKERGAV